MILPKIVDKIQRISEGGIAFNQNRYDIKYVQSIINDFRADWIEKTYVTNKRIHPDCYMKFYPEYNPYQQPENGCFASFTIPNIISIDSESDGIRYVGTDDTTTGQTINFRRIVSRAWLSTYNKNPITNVNNSRWIGFLYDASAGVIDLYGNGKIIKKPPLVELIPANPFDIPTWNSELSNYPLPEDAIPQIEAFILKGQISIISATTPKYSFQPSNK